MGVSVIPLPDRQKGLHVNHVRSINHLRRIEKYGIDGPSFTSSTDGFTQFYIWNHYVSANLKALMKAFQWCLWLILDLNKPLFFKCLALVDFRT